jgi:hypothetical protein
MHQKVHLMDQNLACFCLLKGLVSMLSGGIFRDIPNKNSRFCAEMKPFSATICAVASYLWHLGRLIHKMLGCEC